MIDGWRNAYYGPLGGLGYPLGGAPIHNVVSQEVNDAAKDLSYVRSLENKLKGKDVNDIKGDEGADWDALSNLKKDLGLKVDFVSPTEKREKERAAAAGWEGREAWDKQKMTEAKDVADKHAAKIVEALKNPLGIY